MGLKEVLLHEDLEPEITKVVDDLAETRFHTYAMLHLYANEVCQRHLEGVFEEDLRSQYQNDGYRQKRELFNQTTIDWFIGIAFFKTVDETLPELVRYIANSYYDDVIPRPQRERRTGCGLHHADIRKEMRTTIHTAIQNTFDHATPTHLASVLRQLHDLPGKQARAVAACLSTSLEDRRAAAREANEKRDVLSLSWRRRNATMPPLRTFNV